MSRAVPSPGHQLTTLRANIAETLSPAVITEQGENGYQLEYLTGRHQAPWPTDAQVEQDLVLSRALIEIFKHPHLSRELAFRARYSEDIDLVQIAAGPIGPVMTALRETLDPWLGAPRRSQSEGRMTFIYRFESELPPVAPLRLKIEINTREHFTVLGHISPTHAVENGWFQGSAEIRSYRLEELRERAVRRRSSDPSACSSG